MPIPTESIIIPKEAAAGLVDFQRSCITAFGHTEDLRERMRQVDLQYYREKDQTIEQQRAKAANRSGNADKFQNITVPIIYPQVEEAVVYQASVFLTGHPIFGFVASPENQDAAMQMEAVMEENSIRGGWVRQFIMFFRDGFKYNLSAVEAVWDQVALAGITTELGASKASANAKEVIWSGNVVRRRDPYNTFWDKRYPVTEVSSRGEYAGYNEFMSRTELKAFINKLPSKIGANITAALESKCNYPVGTVNADNAFGYYIPNIIAEVNTDNIQRGAEFDWRKWLGSSGGIERIQYGNNYVVTTIYARIIPEDFKLKVAAQATPQIWKLIYVNHEILISAQRMTNVHEQLPMLFGQPLEDGLSYQTKSLAQNLEPYQAVSSALMNSVIHARRRAISDRILFDPSRVSDHHINSDNPSAKIPCRPAAYGTPMGDAVYQFPFRDENSAVAMSDIQQVMQLANITGGQNNARRGQFQKGNKTLYEYQDVMSNSSGRDELTCMTYEAQVFTPLREMLKLNILQYQPTAKIFSATYQQLVDVDPVKLRETATQFKTTDGKLPSSKVINGDAFTAALQAISSSPQIGAGYNLAPMFSYMMKTQHVDLRPFEKSEAQMAYEQALGVWSSMRQLALEKGTEFPDPQPLPEQFGYQPNPGSIQPRPQEPA